MKIVLYAYPKVYGGLMKHIDLLSEELQSLHEITLFLPKEMAQERNINKVSLKTPQIKHEMVQGKYDWRGCFNLYAFLKQSRPDIFHVHLASPGESTLPFIASRLAGVPVIVATEHAPSYFPLEKFYSKTIKKASQKLIDRIIALSESGRNVLIHRYSIHPKKISVVYNGIRAMEKISREDRRKMRGKLRIGENSFVVLTISEITEKKGIRILLQAAEKLLKERSPVHILMVGEGPLREILQREYKPYVASGRIIFTGYQKDVRPFLSIADLFVLPSLGEEIPFSLLEAMSIGIPVIATAVGGIPEVITHAENGWLVKPHDTKDLRYALCHLLKNPTLARSLSKRASELIQTKLSFSTMIKKTEGIYQSLLMEKLGT